VLGLVALAPHESKAATVYVGPGYYPYYSSPYYYGYGRYYDHHWRHWHRWHHGYYWHHYHPYWD
jgi:hypothetical protein